MHRRRSVVSPSLILWLCVALCCLRMSGAAAAEPGPTPTQTEVNRLQELFQTKKPEALEQMKAVLEGLPADADEGDRREALVSMVGMLMASGEQDQARKLNANLSGLGARYGDDKATAMAMTYQTWLLLKEARYEEARTVIEMGLPVAARTADKKLLSIVNGMAAVVYDNLGNSHAALQHQLVALDALDALESRDRQVEQNRASSMNHVSIIYRNLKDLPLAMEYNERATKLAQQLDAQLLLATLANERGAIYVDMGNLPQASASFLEALSLARKISSFRVEAFVLRNLADLALTENNYADCEKYSQLAKPLSQLVDDADVTAQVDFYIGVCHMGLGAVARGAVEANGAIDFFRKAKADRDVEKMLGQLATAYEKANMHREAVDVLQEQRRLTAKLFQSDRDRAVSQLKAEFEISERQKRIDALEQKNRLQGEEIKVKSLERVIAFLAMIFAGIVAVVLIRAKEDSRRQAQLQNRNKSKFVADAAHDLRQPMQAIGNLLEAAQHAIAREDLPKSRELVDFAQMAAQNMRSSFDSVLEISRLESGLIVADYSNFDLTAMMAEIMQMLMPLADQRGVCIRTRFAKGRQLYVHSDRHLLSRVVHNLLANAIKYSDPAKKNATVIVGVVSLPDRCRVDIVDNGIGIPDAERENIFKPYFQIHNPERDRERGLGLGLSIVNSIMHLLDHHGMRLSSVEGSGTRFSLDIPKAGGNAVHAPEIHAADSSALSDVAGLYVLYVEDDMLVRTATEALFREYGILCESANSFDDLMATLPALERMPDIVLSDFSLPGKRTARDVLDAVAAEFGERIPSIVLSGDSEQNASLQNTGADLVLRKPLSATVLLNEMRKLCLPAETGA